MNIYVPIVEALHPVVVELKVPVIAVRGCGGEHETFGVVKLPVAVRVVLIIAISSIF
jgi:hypothetical protein